MGHCAHVQWKIEKFTCELWPHKHGERRWVKGYKLGLNEFLTVIHQTVIGSCADPVFVVVFVIVILIPVFDRHTA